MKKSDIRKKLIKFIDSKYITVQFPSEFIDNCGEIYSIIKAREIIFKDEQKALIKGLLSPLSSVDKKYVNKIKIITKKIQRRIIDILRDSYEWVPTGGHKISIKQCWESLFYDLSILKQTLDYLAWANKIIMHADKPDNPDKYFEKDKYIAYDSLKIALHYFYQYKNRNCNMKCPSFYECCNFKQLLVRNGFSSMIMTENVDIKRQASSILHFVEYFDQFINLQFPLSIYKIKNEKDMPISRAL